jgi:hypothetical protein
MDDPLPFFPLAEEPVPGLCSKCGLLADVEALKEHISSAISFGLSAAADRFLSNNRPLPAETRQGIASSLGQSTALLEKVDEAVNQLSELLDSLKAARDSLADRVKRSRSVLHPLRTLPDQCLSRIFCHYGTHVDGQDDDIFYGISPQFCVKNPWILTGVSRHWRDVALNTPKVWSNIPVFFTQADHTVWEPSSLSAMNILLTRSATHPLNVFIHSGHSFSMNLHPLLQGVMAHCQRWRRLYLNVPIDMFTFIEQICHNLPLLEHLFVDPTVLDRNTFSEDSERMATEWDNFNFATNLRSYKKIQNNIL